MVDVLGINGFVTLINYLVYVEQRAGNGEAENG